MRVRARARVGCARLKSRYSVAVRVQVSGSCHRRDVRHGICAGNPRPAICIAFAVRARPTRLPSCAVSHLFFLSVWLAITLPRTRDRWTSPALRRHPRPHPHEKQCSKHHQNQCSKHRLSQCSKRRLSQCSTNGQSSQCSKRRQNQCKTNRFHFGTTLALHRSQA